MVLVVVDAHRVGVDVGLEVGRDVEPGVGVELWLPLGLGETPGV